MRQGHPQEHYEAVAHEYARQPRGAAVRLAQAHGVPITTTHAWVKECRRRGLVPPAPNGRYVQGPKLARAASDLGVSPAALRAVLDRHGLVLK